MASSPSTAMAPPLSCSPLQCNSALDRYSEAAEFGTVATRPPNPTTPAEVATAIVLLKSTMAVPDVEAASSDIVAPVSDEFTVAPVTVSKAELYCKVNLPCVTPLPLL